MRPRRKETLTIRVGDLRPNQRLLCGKPGTFVDGMNYLDCSLVMAAGFFEIRNKRCNQRVFNRNLRVFNSVLSVCAASPEIADSTAVAPDLANPDQPMARQPSAVPNQTLHQIANQTAARFSR